MTLLIIVAGVALAAAVLIWPTTGQRVLSGLRGLAGILTALSPAQRKLVYKVAAAAGIAIATKFGLDAQGLTGWGETVGVFITTVLVPVLAHTKVDDA